MDNKKVLKFFHCIFCDYTSIRKSQYDRHLLTTKHKNLTNENKKTEKQFSCGCGKEYTNRHNLCRHRKKCNEMQIRNQECKTEEPVKKINPKKKTIPLTLKRIVWNKYIGEYIGKTMCLCCKLTDISQMSFACGHIISEFNGGEIKLENLKPICMSCNSSMGIKNMNEFIKDYGL
jgi:hypothetical protein